MYSDYTCVCITQEIIASYNANETFKPFFQEECVFGSFMIKINSSLIILSSTMSENVYAMDGNCIDELRGFCSMSCHKSVCLQDDIDASQLVLSLQSFKAIIIIISILKGGTCVQYSNVKTEI